MNIRYLSNLSLFYDASEFTNYTQVDVSSWIWPSYLPDLYNCNPQLPDFLLDQSYSIKVGSNIINSYKYIPFNHWQNSRFLIRVWTNNPLEFNDWSPPSWINANQTDSTVMIVLQNIKSVGVFDIWFQAQLIVGMIDSAKLADYIATVHSTFYITNRNWRLASNFSSLFIVVNKTKSIDISFVDEESDKINLKVIDSGGIGVFITSVNISHFMVYLNCDNDSNNQTHIKFNYTDIYHLNDVDWQSFSINTVFDSV